MTRICSIFLLAMACVAIRPAASDAAPTLTFAYEGTIDYALGGTAYEAFLGETMRVEYTFDGATPDTDTSPYIGYYVGAVSSLTVSVGANTYTAFGDSNIDVQHFIVNLNPSTIFGSDSYEGLDLLLGPAVGGDIPEDGGFSFLSSTPTVFTSDALPLTQPDPSEFTDPSTRLFINFFSDISGGGGGILAAHHIVIVPASVPEPASFSLVGATILGLGWMRRRKLMS